MITIWYHQHANVVDLSGGNPDVERDYATQIGLPALELVRYPGSAAGWGKRDLSRHDRVRRRVGGRKTVASLDPPPHRGGVGRGARARGGAHHLANRSRGHSHVMDTLEASYPPGPRVTDRGVGGPRADLRLTRAAAGQRRARPAAPTCALLMVRQPIAYSSFRP